MEESRLFLDKARESLASAEADFAAGRFNSCANRAYYAAFQAAVAALIHTGVGPRGDTWGHAFVMAQFSGTLIKRRKLVSSSLRASLSALQEARSLADYEPRSVTRTTARRSVEEAGEVVEAVNRLLRS